MPILRIDSFYDGRIVDIRSLKRLKVTSSEMARFQLQVGDIVINRVNSLEYLGKSAIIDSLLEPTVFESNIMKFSVDSSILLPEVCIALLQTSEIRDQVLGKAKNAVNQSSINQGDVRSLRIPLPNMREQLNFLRCTKKIESIKAAAVAGQSRLTLLFSSLQHRAFSGQL
ncbi:restriction endonuclease S subunit [Bradyrhizobium sp. LM2.7]